MERRTAVPVAAAMALGSMVVAAAASFGLLGSSRDRSPALAVPAAAVPAAAGAPAPEVEIRYEDVIVPVPAPVVADAGRVALAVEGAADPVVTTVTAPGSGRELDDDDHDDDDRDDDDRDDDDHDGDRSGRGRGGDDDHSGRGRGGDDE
jgi:hypothetical protein